MATGKMYSQPIVSAPNGVNPGSSKIEYMMSAINATIDTTPKIVPAIAMPVLCFLSLIPTSPNTIAKTSGTIRVPQDTSPTIPRTREAIESPECFFGSSACCTDGGVCICTGGGVCDCTGGGVCACTGGGVCGCSGGASCGITDSVGTLDAGSNVSGSITSILCPQFTQNNDSSCNSRPHFGHILLIALLLSFQSLILMYKFL